MDDLYYGFSSTDYSGEYELELNKPGLKEILESPIAHSILTSLCIGILSLIGFVANVTVIVVTITTKRVNKHPVHSLLVLNLAVADIIYVLASAPYRAMEHTLAASKSIYTTAMCPLSHFVNVQTMSVSIFTICALAIMRFIALMIPFQVSKSCASPSKKCAGLVIVPLVWGLASLLALPNAIYYQLDRYDSAPVYECAWLDSDDKKFYQISLTFITFFIPLLLLIFLHYFIRREITEQQISADLDRKEERKINIMIMFLVLAFFISWLPYNVLIIIKISKSYSGSECMSMMETFDVVAHVISYVHACVNPIIYTFGTPGFRKSSYRMFTSLICNKLCVLLCRNGKKHLVKLGATKTAKKTFVRQASSQHERLTRRSTSTFTTSDLSSATGLLTSQTHFDWNKHLKTDDLKLNLIPNLKMTTVDSSNFNLMTPHIHCSDLNFKCEFKPDWMIMSKMTSGAASMSSSELNDVRSNKHVHNRCNLSSNEDDSPL